jgi:hypothetical protein
VWGWGGGHAHIVARVSTADRRMQRKPTHLKMTSFGVYITSFMRRATLAKNGSCVVGVWGVGVWD